MLIRIVCAAMVMAFCAVATFAQGDNGGDTANSGRGGDTTHSSYSDAASGRGDTINSSDREAESDSQSDTQSDAPSVSDTTSRATSSAFVARLDSSLVVVRLPSSDAVDRLLNDDAFDYGQAYKDPDSLWDRVSRWIIKWLGRIFGDDRASTVWDILIYVIVGAIAIYVAIKLIGADGRSLFFRAKREDDPIDGLANDVHSIDYQTQIASAVEAGELRTAVRLHFLRLLRDLSAAGVITWRQSKTDHDYIVELNGSPFKFDFERAALLFEHVWYGEFPVDLEGYDRIAAIIDGAIHHDVRPAAEAR